MDPIRGAWILLLALVIGVFASGVLIWVGCAVLHEPSMCARSGAGLRDITLEIVTAISVLIAAGKER